MTPPRPAQTTYPTLVLPPRLNDDGRAVRAAALESGWKVYQAANWRLSSDLVKGEPVLYSDPLFADVAAATLDVSLLDPAADWLVSVPKEYTKRRLEMAPLREMRTHTGGPSERRFVRPRIAIED